MKVAIIPARGGSKRIPKKNIRKFLGVPILAYSILAAINSRLFDHIIVSTDDEEVSNVATKYGALVPFKRPKKLSDGFTGIREVISHAAEWLEENNYNPEYICCILATAPLIMINDIKVGLDILKGGKCDYVFTGTPYPYPIKRSIYIDSNDYAKMLYPENSEKRSQDLDDSFHDAGQFYWAQTKTWKIKRNILNCNSRIIILPTWRTCDIDTNDDWELAEILSKHLYKKYKAEFGYLIKYKNDLI